MYLKIIILLLILLIFYYRIEEKLTIDLSKNKIVIDNNELKLINKKNDAIYTRFNVNTYETKSKYFNKIYQNILKENKKKKILVLGFGLGGIPLRLSLEKDIEIIDCVDTDKELYIYFKKLFPNYSTKISLFHADADTYLKDNLVKYDIIIDDVFDGYDKIELDYNMLKERLKMNGKLYLNNLFSKKSKTIYNKLKTIFKKYNNKSIPGSAQSVVIFTK